MERALARALERAMALALGPKMDLVMAGGLVVETGPLTGAESDVGSAPALAQWLAPL